MAGIRKEQEHLWGMLCGISMVAEGLTYRWKK